jgi:hypothetical protein
LRLGHLQWISLRSNDGSLLYFDPQTGQVWSGGPGADTDSRMDVEEDPLREASGSNVQTSRDDRPLRGDFGDEDVMKAARIAMAVSLPPVIYTINCGLSNDIP